MEHLALSIEGLGICFYKEREQKPSVQLHSLSGMGRGKVSFPAKKSGPAVDLVSELRTSHYLLPWVNFTSHVSQNLDRHFLAHFQKDVTHVKVH